MSIFDETEDLAIGIQILRFLQLLCENYNSDMQNYMRIQPGEIESYNLVGDILQLFDCLCGSLTCNYDLLGLLWINQDNIRMVNQVLATLTEFCQGPCRENQHKIISHDSNAIDLVVALVVCLLKNLS